MVRATFAVIGAFIIFVVVHFLHFHYFTPTEKAAAVLQVAALGLFIYLLGLKFLPSEDRLCRSLKLHNSQLLKMVPGMIGFFLYALLFNGYLIFYFTADRSITFRMLRITDEHENSRISDAEMLHLYDTNSIILRRFDDLVYGGYLKQEGSHYLLTTKGQWTLALYRFTIDYLRLGKF